MENVSSLKSSLQRFGWQDYSIFVLMLIICSYVGVYFGYKDRKKRSDDERGALDYLVGGRKMKVFPVAMSLVASYISGISLLGTPTEIYLYGTEYIFILVGFIVATYIVSQICLPVYQDLQLTSAYEYLESRFNKKVRLFGSILFVISTVVWLPIVIYVPALAFNQVTGIHIHIISPIVCGVCIFYTFLGGLKAVIWTDVIQTVVMYGSLLLIMIKGTYDIGGISEIWIRSIDTARIEFPSFSIDPTIRHTVWSLLFGGGFYWVQMNSINQTYIQRFLSLPNLKSMKKAALLYIIGIVIILSMCCYIGLLIFATYHDCDPLTTKLATSNDQVLPLLAMQVLGKFPGLTGLFIAGIFSAALSSMSTALNAMSAVVLEDFYKPFVKKPLSERGTMILIKSVVFILGIACIGLVFIVEHLGNILQVAISFTTIGEGPLFGIFIMGLLIPWVTSTGVLTGGITGLIIMACLNIQTQLSIARGDVFAVPKAVTTEGCSYDFMNVTLNSFEKSSTSHLSYLWFSVIGTSATIITGVAVSFICGPAKLNEIDINLIAPISRRFVKKSLDLRVYEEVPQKSTKL